MQRYNDTPEDQALPTAKKPWCSWAWGIQEGSHWLATQVPGKTMDSGCMVYL